MARWKEISDPYLALQTLDEMPHCHSGWDGVGIDDYIRCYPLTGKRHVLQHTDRISGLIGIKSALLQTGSNPSLALTFQHPPTQTQTCCSSAFPPLYLLSVLDTTGPFLPMSAGKFISNLGDPDGADLQERENCSEACTLGQLYRFFRRNCGLLTLILQNL